MTVRTVVPIGVRRAIKIARARAFEAAGSERYGRPALNRLDTQMLDYLPARGTFLEIGANDGYSQSNTYYLERFQGWTGVLIEPLPKLFRICRWIRRRSACLNVACVADSSVREVTLLNLDLVSVALGLQDIEDEKARVQEGAQLTVPAMTLSSALDLAGHGAVDFMSVDVEGAELSVLGGLDWGRHTPRFLLVETKYPEVIDQLSQGLMVRVAQLSHHDYVWARHA